MPVRRHDLWFARYGLIFVEVALRRSASNNSPSSKNYRTSQDANTTVRYEIASRLCQNCRCVATPSARRSTS